MDSVSVQILWKEVAHNNEVERTQERSHSRVTRKLVSGVLLVTGQHDHPVWTMKVTNFPSCS